jgi:enediyne biosynthesis protein E4
VSGCSFLSSNDPRLHFGLGEVASADIEARWPSELVEHVRGAATNQLLTLREGEGQVKGRSFR